VRVTRAARYSVPPSAPMWRQVSQETLPTLKPRRAHKAPTRLTCCVRWGTRGALGRSCESALWAPWIQARESCIACACRSLVPLRSPASRTGCRSRAFASGRTCSAVSWSDTFC